MSAKAKGSVCMIRWEVVLEMKLNGPYMDSYISNSQRVGASTICSAAKVKYE